MDADLPFDPNHPPISVIRDLLMAAFVDADELLRFCYFVDELRPMADAFARPLKKPDMVFELVRYCEQRNLWAKLLAGTKEANAYQYGRYEARLAGPAAGPVGGQHGDVHIPSPSQGITWLHLSDLHFRPAASWDESIVLRALVRDVADRVRHDGLRPDFIVVSGDIAYAGRPEEYELAGQFFDELLAAAGLADRGRLFVVPGNHDVDRDAISTLAAGAANVLNDRAAVNRFLASDGDRALILLRLRGYREFVNRYFGAALVFDDAHYSYVTCLSAGGRDVAVLGLNSAWLAYGGPEDQGRLLLGERQVRTALARAEAAQLRLAVMHHPFDWLRAFDRSDAEALLCQSCDLILHGHMHQAGLLQARTPDSQATIVAAGAAYETRDYANAYNYVRLDPAAGSGAIYLRTYSDRQGGFWTKDVLNYRNVPDGVYRFELVPRDTAPADSRAGGVGVPARPGSTGRETGERAPSGAQGKSTSPSQPQTVDLAAVRDLLRAAFSPEELRRLCVDTPDLRPIVSHFGSHFSLEDMIDAVIDYCDKRVLFPELLAAVRRANPRQYGRFEDRLPSG